MIFLVVSGYQRGEGDCTSIPSIFTAYNLINCLNNEGQYFQIACSEDAARPYCKLAFISELLFDKVIHCISNPTPDRVL